MKVNIQVAPVYAEFLQLFFDSPYKQFSLYSGRGAGKTTLAEDLSLNVVMTIGCVFWTRANYNTLRDSCFQGLITRIHELGLGAYFDIGYSPLIIKCKITGYAIQFKGLKDFQKSKGLNPLKGSCKLIVHEEVQEITTEAICSEFNTTIIRGESDDCKVLYLMNPLPDKNAWQNQDLRETIENFRYCLKTCYTDLPREWLGETFIETAERLKESNYKLYRYRYLGEAVSPEDAIFENLKVQEISDESIERWIREDENLFVGLDFGYKPDPNAANMMYYDTDARVLYIFMEFQQGELNNQQISDGLLTAGFTTDYIITADNCDKDISDLNSFGWSVRPAIKGPGSRDKGFKWLCGLSQIVIDPIRCPKTANEFESYVYKANKEGVITGLFPEGQDDHHIAAVRYAMESVWRRKGM